jgi:hypothetical protein
MRRTPLAVFVIWGVLFIYCLLTGHYEFPVVMGMAAISTVVIFSLAWLLSKIKK